MPTRHKRIAVVADPQLAAALSEVSAKFPGRSSASTLRELALIGAETLKASDVPESKLDRILAIPGARPAKGSMSEFLRTRTPLGPVDPAYPDALSRALDEQREDKI